MENVAIFAGPSKLELRRQVRAQAGARVREEEKKFVAAGCGDQQARGPRYPDQPLHVLREWTMPAPAAAAGAATEMKLCSEDHVRAFPVEITFDGRG